VATTEERREFEARRGYWTQRLRREYLHQVLQPRWVQPAAAAGYRAARAVYRKLRSVARRVVG